MNREASIPPGKLRRMVRMAYDRADPEALTDLRSWADEHPAEAAHCAAHDKRLAALLCEFKFRPT